MSKSGIQVGFVRSARQLDACKAAGRNYYDAYWEEILSELGTASQCYGDLRDCCNHLEDHKLIILGDVAAAAEEETALRRFVENGGILVGSLTAGLNSLFGVSEAAMHYEADDEYTIQAYAGWTEEGKGYLPPNIRDGITLPVISRYRECTLKEEAKSLLFFVPPTSFAIGGGKDSGIPGLTVRNLGLGKAYYFTFSLAQTLCVLHQGRPVTRDWDGDGYYRTGDAIALTQCHDLTVPYGDLYNSILRTMLDMVNAPSIWQLPPTEDGEITDLIVHFGGDDEYDWSNVQVPAAERMNKFGLPYHINILPGGKYGSGKEFAVSKEQYEYLKELGCERSIHFDFFRARTFFTEEEVNEQLDTFEKIFGETPICSVNHVMMWTGWSDFPRWCEKRGLKGDASRVHVFLVPDANPINKFGLAFGTAFPHFVMDDWRYGNRMMRYCYLPVMLYEPRVSCKHREEDEAALAAMLERSKDEGWMLNFFIHPIYVSRDEDCIRAIAFMRDYVRDRKYKARYFGTDETCLWWHSRNASSVTGNNGAFTVRADYKDGAVIRFPDSAADCCLVDGVPAKLERRVVSGIPCKLLAVRQGTHKVII